MRDGEVVIDKEEVQQRKHENTSEHFDDVREAFEVEVTNDGLHTQRNQEEAAI